MTANTLSNKDRGKVASAAMPNRKPGVQIYHGQGIVTIGHHGGCGCAFTQVWEPRFDGDDFQRSQALALVEWLTDRIMKSIDGQDNYFRQLLSAIYWRDTAALEYMAHQMITKGKEDE